MSARYAFASSFILPILNRSRSATAPIFSPRHLSCRPTPCTWTATATGQPSAAPPFAKDAQPAAPRLLRKGDTLDLVIDKLAYGGASVAYIPQSPERVEEDVGMPVYAPRGAHPGEIVRCAVTKVRRRGKLKLDPSITHATPVSTRSYAEAIFVKRLATSPNAVESPCKHFGNFKLGGGGCGGCSSLHVAYQEQIRQKQAQMNNVYAKICRKYGVKVLPVLESEHALHYRNKMEFSFGRRWYEIGGQPNEIYMKGPTNYEYTVGLHAPQRYDKVVQIESCPIQQPIGDEILNYVRERSPALLLEPYDTKKKLGYLRNVGIRTSTNARGEVEVMVNLVTSPCDVPGRLVPFATEITEKFPSVVCVVQNMSGGKGGHDMDEDRERLLAGSKKYIEQVLGRLVFRISANSFFQTNPMQAQLLYNEVQKAAKLTSDDTVLDLFCGTGTIGLSLAACSKHVVGIDIVASAIEDANENAMANNIANVTFEQGNLDKVDAVLKGAGIPDANVVVVDPPRAGLHPGLLKFLAQCQAKRIVYVSCNPVSQVRDLELLEEKAEGRFRVSSIQPVDMFPNTPHVESVATLERV